MNTKDTEPEPAKPQEIVPEEKEDPKLPNKKGRIIMRNLVYDVKEKHLRKLFEKYGEISEINIPVNPATNRAKGFAFVQLTNKNLALKAIKELNESKFKGRTITLDLSVEKHKYDKLRNQSKSDGPDTKKDTIQTEEDANKIQEEEKEENGHQEASEDEEESNEDDPDADDERDDDADVEDDEEIPDEEKGEIDEEEEEEEERPPEDLKQTVFVRNISFETREPEFKKFFYQFGKIFFAKLVMRRDAETHNGSGFVKFKSADIAQKLIKESERIEKLDPLATSTGLSEYNFELGGRRLKLLPALGRQEVGKIQESRKEQDDSKAPKNKGHIDYWIYHDKQKKRNFYLAKMGLNEPLESFNEFDKKKFEENIREKVSKMQNPNYHISKTKIIFKNLPKRDFEEEELRQVIYKIMAEKLDEKTLKKKKIINKIKIEKEKDRVLQDGTLRSRGFAFVEFVQHEDALFFLEKIKTKYTLISTKKTPIVEFAFEDIKELKKHENILKKLEENKKKYSKQNQEVNEEEKERKAKERKNAQTIAKIQIEMLVENGNPDSIEKIREHLKQVTSRGLKQRMKKKVSEKFGIPMSQVENGGNGGNTNTESIKTNRERIKDKIARKEEIKKEKTPKKNKKFVEDDAEELKKIKKTIKNKKREKRRATENDQFDEMAMNYLKKTQKRL